MNILFVSGELIGASLCKRLIAEGHAVKLYVEKDGWKSCLDGLIQKTPDWRSELEWVGKDGLIVFDDIGFGREQDDLRVQGYRVVGGSAGGDELESDRKLFQDLLAIYQIPVIRSRSVKSIDDALAAVREDPGEWVVKQSTHMSMLNYVGEREDGSDVLGILESYRAQNIPITQLQKRVRGVEVGIARYFNGTDWVGPIEINHEHKRMCNGDIGPLTHEMGTIMWYSDDEHLPLFERTLGRFKPYLQEIDFRGDIDINCIVNESGIWPLEATPRFGNPSTPLQSELHISPWSEFLGAVADGSSYQLKYKRGYGIVVSIAIPPFPNPPFMVDMSQYKSFETLLGFRETLTNEEWEHIHFEEIAVRRDKNGTPVYYWAGNDGWVMHVTAEGVSIPDAQEKVYALIKKLILPRMFYRTDIGDRVHQHDLPNLKAWGWI